MMTNLENLLTEDQIKNLVDAINANKDFKLAKDGLTIESNSTDNTFQIKINFDATKEESYLANKEAEDFKKLINDIDDEIFVTACEQLGSETLQAIQSDINSKDLKSVRFGINKFKSVLENIIVNKIHYYKICLNSLHK